MKKYFLILFSVFQIQTYANQIPIGLNTKNIISWNFWENNNGKLKHYLCLYNKTQKEIKIEIKLKKFKSVGANFEEVKTKKIFYKVNLVAGQLMKLEYPEQSDKLGFMEFLEEDLRIGLLSFNLEKPEPSFVQDKYKYYSNAGINGGATIFWMRLESIYHANTEIGIFFNLKNDNESFLIKIIDLNKNDGESYWTKLNTLQKTDSTIIKLDQLSPIYTFQLRKDFGEEKIVIFEIIAEHIEENKMVSAHNTRTPIFKQNITMKTKRL